MTISAVMEDYVRAIYDLQGGSERVSTSALSERMEVAPATATGMVRRLARRGLAEYEPYAGVQLTPAGERVALEVIRHHRLIEAYLAEAMGLSWDQVHDEAHRLEHHISDELLDRMAEILGHPERDPHGAPIPPEDGPFDEPAYAALAEAKAGQRLVIRQVVDEDAERLRYLGELGLRPDVAIEVVEVGPFKGPIVVQVGEERHTIGHELAKTVSVEVVGSGAADAE